MAENMLNRLEFDPQDSKSIEGNLFIYLFVLLI